MQSTVGANSLCNIVFTLRTLCTKLLLVSVQPFPSHDRESPALTHTVLLFYAPLVRRFDLNEFENVSYRFSAPYNVFIVHIDRRTFI